MRLEDLRGTKPTDNVYLVGNGSNLDVRALKNPAFATNLVSRIYPQTDWRPRYYVCTDPVVLDNYRFEVEESIKACEFAFLPHTALQTYTGKNIVPLIVKGEETDLPVTEGIYGHGSTLFIALKLAQHMGFEEVTYLGCDLYFGKQLHFYPPEDDIMAKLSQQELSRRRLRSVQSHFHMIVFANKHRMRINYL